MSIAVRLGHNIRTARDEQGLTQTQLATALGLGEAQTVSNWERGLFRPSEQNLAGLCEVLGHDIAWFYTAHSPDGAPA